MAVLLLNWNQTRWKTFQFGSELRLLIIIAALPLVWSVVGLDYNFYFERAYHLDRIILLVCLLGVWYHPAFVFPLTISIFVTQGQLAYPLGLSDTSEHLPRQALLLFSAFLFLRVRYHSLVSNRLDQIGLQRIVDTDTPDEYLFFWTLGSVIAASYVVPGVGKALLLWPFREIVAYHLPWAYIRGWLWQLEAGTVELLFGYLVDVNPLLTWGTLVVEIGMIAFMWHRRIMRAFAAIVIGFQLAIFAVSGILFKKWFFVLVGFAWCVSQVDSKATETLFDRRTQVIVTTLIILAVILPAFYPVTTLAWYSSAYDRTYTVEAVSENGNTYKIGWDKMAPYERSFRQNRFAFLDRQKSLSREGARTTSDWERLRKIRQATTATDVDRLRSRFGTVQYNANKSASFNQLIRRHFRSQVCERERNSVIWGEIPSPPHLFWGVPDNDPPTSVRYEKVQIRRTDYLYTNGNIQQINSTIVKSISVKSC